MKTNYEVRYAASPQDVKSYDTTRLRDEFLIDNLMSPDEVNLVYSHYDRFISGSAVPVKEVFNFRSYRSVKGRLFSRTPRIRNH